MVKSVVTSNDPEAEPERPGSIKIRFLQDVALVGIRLCGCKSGSRTYSTPPTSSVIPLASDRSPKSHHHHSDDSNLNISNLVNLSSIIISEDFPDAGM